MQLSDYEIESICETVYYQALDVMSRYDYVDSSYQFQNRVLDDFKQWAYPKLTYRVDGSQRHIINKWEQKVGTEAKRWFEENVERRREEERRDEERRAREEREREEREEEEENRRYEENRRRRLAEEEERERIREEQRRIEEEERRREEEEEARRQAEDEVKRKAQNEANKKKLEEMQTAWRNRQQTPIQSSTPSASSAILQSCPKCGVQVSVSSKFCTACGAKLIAICSNCGVTLKPSAKFCTQCGTTVN